jgi:hypothetical protein
MIEAKAAPRFKGFVNGWLIQRRGAAFRPQSIARHLIVVFAQPVHAFSV